MDLKIVSTYKFCNQWERLCTAGFALNKNKYITKKNSEEETNDKKKNRFLYELFSVLKSRVGSMKIMYINIG